MVHCKELAGKVIQEAALYEDGQYGPELSIKFTDGTEFNFCVSNRLPIEAKLLRNTSNESAVLHDYSVPPQSF